MPSFFTSCALAASILLPSVTAHSHIPYVVVDGEFYPGFIPNQPAQAANAVGWTTTVKDDGFISPSNYTNLDIICHRGATPAQAHVPITQGDKIHMQWNGWPKSHAGPILSYLAPCTAAGSSDTFAEDGCASVNKTSLEFFKIDNSAPVFLNDSGGPPGYWATDVLIASNNSWLVEIPKTLPSGPYVLRHEIIALHYANETNGAQNYPQCVNLWVGGGTTSSGTLAGRSGESSRYHRSKNMKRSLGGNNKRALNIPKGMPATQFYQPKAPGIQINISKPMTTYVIPGPALATDAVPVPMQSQSNMMFTAVGTPVAVSQLSTKAFAAAGTATAAP